MEDNIIMIILGFAVTLIAIMTPLIRLNTSITTLNVTMEMLSDSVKQIKVEQDEKIKNHDCVLIEHGKLINDCDKRIYSLESWKETL